MNYLLSAGSSQRSQHQRRIEALELRLAIDGHPTPETEARRILSHRCSRWDWTRSGQHLPYGRRFQ